MPDTEGSSLLDPIADVDRGGRGRRLASVCRRPCGPISAPCSAAPTTGSARTADGATNPFADLLARLEIALAQAEGERDKTFRAGLLEVVPALHRFAVSLTRDPAAADDLVQDTLLRGWRGRGGFTPGTNLEAWLFTILRNVFYSQHRKQGREVADTDGNYAERLTSIPEQGATSTCRTCARPSTASRR